VWPQELGVVQWKSANLLAPFPLYKPAKMRKGRAALKPIIVDESAPLSQRYLNAMMGNYQFPASRQPQFVQDTTIHTDRYLADGRRGGVQWGEGEFDADTPRLSK